MSTEPQTSAPPSMLAVARYYARLGWAVFPLRPGQKIPLTRHGCLDASTNAEVIREWWREWPDANVGIACGPRTRTVRGPEDEEIEREGSDLLVVDIDGDEGETRLAELVAEHGALPDVPEVRTGRGRHLYFQFDPRVKNSAKRIPLIDTRSSGGYVVAPPSVHPSGGLYEWVDDKGPKSLRPVPAPEWLLEKFIGPKVAAREPRSESLELPATTVTPVTPDVADSHDTARRTWARQALRNEADDLASEREGSRGSAANKSAFKLGGYVPQGLLTKREIADALFEACDRNGLCDKDGDASVRSAISRGLDAGAGKPRTVGNDVGARARSAPARPAPPRERAAPATSRDDEPPDDDGPPPVDDGFDEPPDEPDELPAIFDEFDENRMAELADEHLSGDPGLYQRGGLLVQVLRDDSPGAGVTRGRQAPKVAEIDVAWLRALTTRRVRWMRHRRVKGLRQEQRIKPPMHAITAIAKRGYWHHIRKLEGVSTTPVFRPDGSILRTPGYDTLTGVLYEPYEAFPTIPDRPTSTDVEGAVELLRMVVSDFPFETSAHEACWFAAIVTLVARYAFRGPAPMFLIDATTPGTGKGLLARITAIIGIGQPPTMVTHSKDEAEEKKLITSIAIEGDACVLIDNIVGRFGSAAMCSVLTSDEYSGRVLGVSKSYKGPMLTTWLATANNIALETDMVRRSAHVRLVSKEEKPEERTGFAIPNLESYVIEHRPRLVSAVLTILRGWHAAGRPTKQLNAWGSFEGWSNVVRQCLVWAGLTDPGDAREALREATDGSTDQLIELVSAWSSTVPPGSRLTAGELLTKAKDDSAHDLRDALDAYSFGKTLNAKSIGRTLVKYRGRIVDGRKIEGVKDSVRKQWVWWVARADGSLSVEREAF